MQVCSDIVHEHRHMCACNRSAPVRQSCLLIYLLFLDLLLLLRRHVFYPAQRMHKVMHVSYHHLYVLCKCTCYAHGLYVCVWSHSLECYIHVRMCAFTMHLFHLRSRSCFSCFCFSLQRSSTDLPFLSAISATLALISLFLLSFITCMHLVSRRPLPSTPQN